MVWAGVLFQRIGKKEWFFHQCPVRGAAMFVVADALCEFIVIDLRGGDVGDVQVSFYRQFFRVSAFAGARTAENQGFAHCSPQVLLNTNSLSGRTFAQPSSSSMGAV